MKPALALVAAQPTPADILRELLPLRQETAQSLAHIDRLIDEQRRLFAKELGLKFIRVEALPAMLREDGER